MDFYIIGIGMGSPFLLTQESIRIIQSCEAVLSMERTASLVVKYNANIIVTSYSQLIETAVALKYKALGIAVSGDCGFYSAANNICCELNKYGTVHFVCGINSMQYFCSRLNKAYDDAYVVSLHGRKGSLLGAVSYNKKVFALTGGENNANSILNELNDNSLGKVQAYVGEKLSYDEKITIGSVSEICSLNFSEPAVILLENPTPASKKPLNDCELIRTRIPMTKEAVRWISVNKLNISRHSVCCDIGCGTGAVSIELAKKACDGIVYAIDKNSDAVELTKKNIEKTGCCNIKTMIGNAPEILDELPYLDTAFIGGSSGNIQKIIKKLKSKNNEIKIVINTVSIEGFNSGISAVKQTGIKNIEVTSVNISEGSRVGEYSIMRANNPIMIISGGGK